MFAKVRNNPEDTENAFTLIEVVVYISVLVIILSAVINFMMRITETSMRLNVSTILVDNGQLILDEITRTVRAADDVVGVIPAIPEGTVTLQPIADSWIYAGSYNANNGTETYLAIRPWHKFSRRSLLRFDLSSIPKGAVVKSAYLRLRERGTYGVPRTIAAHRVTKNWTEGTGSKNSGVTWSAYDGITPWDTNGGDYESIPTDEAFVTYNPYIFPVTNEWNITTDVQNFLDDIFPNYGWLLRDTIEDDSQHYWHFYSRESAIPPVLVVEYGPDIGSIFNTNPGMLIVRYSRERVIFDTYTKAITMYGKQVTLRKLRMKRGLNPPIDITSDDVDVTRFVLMNRTRGNGPANIKMEITLDAVNPLQNPQRAKSISFHTAISVRKK